MSSDVTQTPRWNRGAYLAEGLGHCNACHAPRNFLGATKANGGYAGALVSVSQWYAPELSADQASGLGQWSVDEVAQFLKSGVSARGAAYGPMADVVGNSLQYLSDADAQALATYIKSRVSRHGPPDDQLRDANAPELPGAKIYEDRCGGCHGTRGEGAAPGYPPLAHNPSVSALATANPIRMVLNGGFPPSTHGNPRPFGMPPFGQSLSDLEIAQVVTFVRQSWGNAGSAVGPADVERARGAPIE